MYDIVGDGFFHSCLLIALNKLQNSQQFGKTVTVFKMGCLKHS